MRVREIIDLAELLQGAPVADDAAASLGTIRGRVGDWLTLVSPREPRYREIQVETTGSGALAGIAVTLDEPEVVRWDQLAARFGPAAEMPNGRHGGDGPASIVYGGAVPRTPLLVCHRADPSRIRQVILRRTCM